MEKSDTEITAFLAFRPTELTIITETPYDQKPYYAVMLLETPQFPGKQHVESQNMTVLCAAKYDTSHGESGDEPRWGWVHMEAATKEDIGRMLSRNGATTGKWYCLYIMQGIGHRPLKHFVSGVES